MPTPKEHWNYTIEEWKRADFQRIINALPEIKCFYDIGANVGGFTHVMLERFPKAFAYCFEPVTDNFTELVKNVPKAKHLQLGIYYGATQSKVYWRGSNEGAIFLEFVDAGSDKIDRGEVVELSELESLVLHIPDLIKLDVEGSELNIIEHSQTIKRCPNLIIEWHPTDDPIEFFKKHLPDHRVVVNLSNQQFLLSK